nr:hypothetical protein [uncultured Capnocytophaga sp.]
MGTFIYRGEEFKADKEKRKSTDLASLANKAFRLQDKMTYNEFVQLMERPREIVPEMKKECPIVKNKSNIEKQPVSLGLCFANQVIFLGFSSKHRSNTKYLEETTQRDETGTTLKSGTDYKN